MSQVATGRGDWTLEWQPSSRFPSPPTGSAVLSAITGGLPLRKSPGITSCSDFLAGEPFPFRFCSQTVPSPVGPHHIHPGGPSSLHLAFPTVFYPLPNTFGILLCGPFPVGLRRSSRALPPNSFLFRNHTAVVAPWCPPPSLPPPASAPHSPGSAATRDRAKHSSRHHFSSVPMGAALPPPSYPSPPIPHRPSSRLPAGTARVEKRGLSKPPLPACCFLFSPWPTSLSLSLRLSPRLTLLESEATRCSCQSPVPCSPFSPPPWHPAKSSGYLKI